MDGARLDEHRLRLLELYAGTLGHLCSRQGSTEALERSEKRLRLVTDALPVCITYIDADHRYRFLNETGARWFGTSRDKVIRVHVRDVIGAGAYEKLRESLETALAGGDVDMETEITVQTRGQRFVRALFVPDRTVEGSSTGVYSLLLDITHRKQADQARAQLAAIVEASDDAVISTRIDGHILTWNAGAERIFGYHANEAIGRDISILFPAEFDGQFAKLVERFLQGEHIESFETVRNRKDGRSFDASVTVSAHCDNRGPLIGVSAVVRDITDRKRSEKQMARHREQLRSLTSELTLAEERERRSLALNLHDDLGQTLAVAKMRLDLLVDADGPASYEPLRPIVALIDAAHRAVRTLAFQISPPVLHDLGFNAALDWLVDHFKEHHELDITFDGDKRLDPMDERMRVVLFRSVRELLINVAKHA